MNEEDVPSFLDLHHDPEMARKMDQFKVRLNANPPEKWLKKNPYANNSQYLPIDKVEQFLDSIFQDWQIEVKSTSVMFNSVACTVRVHYWHPVKQAWRFHDGVGAHNMQKDSETDEKGNAVKSILSMETIKDYAVKMALPIAKSEAIKDACDHLGKLFGRDLNRKNTVSFIPAYMGKPNGQRQLPQDKSSERLMEMINSATTLQSLEKLRTHLVTADDNDAYDMKFKELRP